MRRAWRDVDIRSSRSLALVSLIGVLILTAACLTPIGVSLSDPQDVHDLVSRSVLTSGKPSAATEQTLHRVGLADRFDDDPAGAIRQLRGDGTDLSSDRLFALAELSFVYAQQENRRDYYLAAAVYAYAFLFRKDGAVDEPLDARTRLAADLYNFGLSAALTVPRPETDASAGPATSTAAAEAIEVSLADRALELPFGRLEVRGNPAHFLWGGFRMNRFIAVGEFKIRGLRNRYRQPGIGAALAADLTDAGTGPDAEIARTYIPPRIKVPVTAFVRIDNVAQGIADGQLRGKIELYAADAASTVEVEGRRLPLETEPSAVLAYTLEGAPVWDTELAAFLSPASRVVRMRLGMLNPYRPGRIPIILIHGTASSPARWADMVNELNNDPVLRGRIQFWLFTYYTSNPILQSASELRQSLLNVVKDLDPEGLDPALRRMVLIGHSQGGLLARLMVTDSGNRFWASVSHVPFSDIKGSPEARALIKNAMFFEPVPYVKRVVFIATPHGGSYQVSAFVMNLVRRVVSLPVDLVKDVGDLARLNPDISAVREAAEAMPTAVDNMRPGGRFLKTLAGCPIAPGVTAHSIIAVLGEGPVSGKTDGVVAYESAHLDGVASEKVVRSPHSCQAEPDTILEVRRILRDHVAGR